MTRKLAIILATFPIGLGMLCSGCSKKPSASTSTVEATVSGIVTIDGKPVTQGEVSFDPANYLRKNETARTAPIGPDGRYTIRTLVGYNSVQIAAPQLAKQAVPSSGDEGLETADASMGVGYELLEFDVQAGDNTFDIELHQAKSGLRG